MVTPQNIKQIIVENKPDEALRKLDELLASTTSLEERGAILAEKGKILWRLDRRGEAISAYEEGTQIDPSGPCAPLLEMSGQIMSFFNKDLLNP